MKIYELRPLNPFIQTSPIACKALHSRLRYLLEHSSSPALLSPSFNVIDDFLVRALYTLPTSPAYSNEITTSLIPNEDLKIVYESNPADTIKWYVASQRQDISVPRWICSRTTEIFFEGDRTGIRPDLDEIGLATSIITCLLRLPKDVRAKIMQGIVVVGGGAAIPGLRTRLQNSLEMKWKEKVDKRVPQTTTVEGSPPGSSYGDELLSVRDLSSKESKRAFKFIQANPLEATFQGASLLGDIKVKGLLEVQREAFNNSQGRDLRDWTQVGGVGEEGVEESKRRSRT
jgi:hypothetical protein